MKHNPRLSPAKRAERASGGKWKALSSVCRLLDKCGFDRHMKVQFHLERPQTHICQISLSEWLAARVYCSWICDTDHFSLRLCSRLRQSRAVWPGRQEPPIASKRTVSHSEHSEKDFNENPPPPQLSSTSTALRSYLPPALLFLITHCSIPVSGREFHKYFQAAWMHVSLRRAGKL